MKKISVVAALCFFAVVASAQTQTVVNTSTVPPVKVPALDKSPLDVSYFPIDYPVLKTQSKTASAPLIRVIYSRPQKDNRNIFGELIEYNKVWRLGANEATEIEFFKDAVIAGKKIPKGRYTLYAIPTETKWTIIVNKDTDVWGAFAYDQKKDVLRTEVPVSTGASPVEAFSISFSKSDKGAALLIAWDKVNVSLPIEIK
jgi:hypothetical protein